MLAAETDFVFARPDSHTVGVFTKNRDRLLTTEMSRKVMAAILAHREVAPLLSDDHFSVDGALVKAWASMNCVQPRTGKAQPDDDPGPRNPRHRSIQPHQSQDRSDAPQVPPQP